MFKHFNINLAHIDRVTWKIRRIIGLCRDKRVHPNPSSVVVWNWGSIMWSYACSGSNATTPDGITQSKGAFQHLEAPFGTDNCSAWDSGKKVNGLAQTVTVILPQYFVLPPHYRQSFSCHLSFLPCACNTILVKKYDSFENLNPCMLSYLFSIVVILLFIFLTGWREDFG